MKVLLGRLPGSLSLFFHTNGSIHGAGVTTCPATKRNGDPCGRPLKDYEHLIECPSHGFRFYLHSKLEDVIYACYRDALRIELSGGKAGVCKNNDKRRMFLTDFLYNFPSSGLSLSNVAWFCLVKWWNYELANLRYPTSHLYVTQILRYVVFQALA